MTHYSSKLNYLLITPLLTPKTKNTLKTSALRQLQLHNSNNTKPGNTEKRVTVRLASLINLEANLGREDQNLQTVIGASDNNYSDASRSISTSAELGSQTNKVFAGVQGNRHLCVATTMSLVGQPKLSSSEQGGTPCKNAQVLVNVY